METRKIGTLNVSAVGLGCNNFGWRIGPEESAAVIYAAIDQGINFFDTADVYGIGQSEEFMGRAFGARRKEVLLATKFGIKLDDQRPGGAKPAYIRRAVEDSLRRLATDHIDLYQIHKPDPETPIADTLGVLDDLVRAGKVREIGCSNFSAEQLQAAAAVKPGAARFVSVQNEYSLLKREPEAEVLPECVRQGIAFIPYFPLANGLLTGKYRQGQPIPEGSRAQAGFGPKVFTEENLALVESLIRFAESRGHTLLELAMSWLACQPAVASVIAGAKSVAQVKANAAAAGWRLSPADLVEVQRTLASRTPPVPPHLRANGAA
ncbi:MAG TPA: aldo/keto reductase [Bryobacteraceae bacterium]|jgi:aryl-alcohol dehydrogenase-like predicted oxidoreductase|nr:aldo/keto reductase [Bryobacteraceae bacterium]